MNKETRMRAPEDPAAEVQVKGLRIAFQSEGE